MTDKEILEKFIGLEKSCFTDKEKKEVMDILYKYNDAAFSGGCKPISPTQ